MTRFAWSAAALLLLPVGCTLLANNALPEDDAAGGAPSGTAGNGPTTSSGGGGTGGVGGASGGGGDASGGGECMPTAATENNCFDGDDNDCLNGIDCNDSACAGIGQCTDEVISGASYVLDGLGSCPSGYSPLPIASCEGCGCSAAEKGTCQYQTMLFDDPDCTNQVAMAMVAEATCVEVTATASAGNVHAMAQALPLDPPTCEAAAGPVPAATRTLCQANGIGACGESMSCVPLHPAATTCLLFDGDVATCPASRPERELVFVGGTGECPCQCGVATQDCSGVNHTHAYNLMGCAEPPNYTTIENGAPCKDMGHPLIQSLDNHDAVMQAADATCENKAPPPNGVAKTLCCE